MAMVYPLCNSLEFYTENPLYYSLPLTMSIAEVCTNEVGQDY